MRDFFQLTCVLAFAVSAAAQTPAYTTLDFPGATATLAWGINNLGDVVGLYSLPDKTNHGFLWSGGRLTSLDFPGATSTDTYGINSQGDIVGDYTLDGVMHGFVYTQGRYVTVDIPGAGATALAAINNNGDIVAAYNIVAGDGISRTAIIQSDVIYEYDYPNATSTLGNGINDAGDMVANYTIAGVTHGFLLSRGATTTLDYPGSTFTGTYGISSAGDIVGRYRDAAGVTHGFIYSGGKYTTLDIPNATATGVDAINSVGDLVGRYTSNGVTHAFVMNSPVAAYTITDLGTLPGGAFSQANAVSAGNGLVTGVSDVPGGSQHAALWQFGQAIDLAAKGLGGPNSNAYGLNSAGAVVGQAETGESDPEDFCYYGTGFRCVPFIWQNGVMSQLPALGGPNGNVSAVNASGAIAGATQTSTRDASCAAPIFHAFEGVVWGPAFGQVRPLRPLPGDTVSAVLNMNDRGQVVGVSGLCANTSPSGFILGPHAVLWDSDGTAVDLGSLGGSVNLELFGIGNQAGSINNVGQVVGVSSLPGNQAAHAFLWTRDSGMKDLGLLSGDTNSGALSINDRGEIVGVSVDGEGNTRPYLWRNGLMADLNTLAPAGAPLYLLFANNINNRGEITGFGVTGSGDVHAFLATPDYLSPRSQKLGLTRPEILPEAARKLRTRQSPRTH